MQSKHEIDAGDETIIELSRTKIVLLLLGASAFVAAGVWMLTLDEASIQSQRRFNDPLYVHGLGLVSIVFFGACGLFALKKLFDNKPALVFNNSGIVDHASSVAAGFIPWSEVERAEIIEIQKQKLLIIKVRDPQQYIARGSSLKQALNKANYKMVGSPISISSHALQVSFSELVAIFDRYQRKYGVGPGRAGARHPHPGPDVRSPELCGGLAGHDGGPFKPGAGPLAQLLNWSPGAVRATAGAGGIGIFVLSTSSLDVLFHIQLPFWAAFTASLLPMLVFFVAVPDILPRRVVRPAQWLAAVWYLVLSALAIPLAAFRGFESVDLLLVGFIMLGAWPCLLALRKLRG